MILSRTLRRFVASSVAALFLLCQGTVGALARSGEASTPNGGAAQESCHEIAPQTGGMSLADSCHATCQSQNTGSAPPIAQLPDATDLPAITARLDRRTAVAHSAALADSLQFAIEPRPLSIVHCRLRN